MATLTTSRPRAWRRINAGPDIARGGSEQDLARDDDPAPGTLLVLA
jgi:hypothetical protein